jgi:hypothetical protein
LPVLASRQRRGLGGALVSTVCTWARAQGCPTVTLTTFRDVPWNGPFYQELGFSELNRLTTGSATIRQHERDIGDDGLGPQLAVRLDLPRRNHAPGRNSGAREGGTSAPRSVTSISGGCDSTHQKIVPPWIT